MGSESLGTVSQLPTENPFRQALKDSNSLTPPMPLMIVGAVNAYSALLAERAGHRALYLSGAGVANSSFGLPDLAMTTIDEVAEDAKRITAVTKLPLLVDIDTGFGDALGIGRAMRKMQEVNVAAVHMEDQVAQKRCGHRPNKALVAVEEMCDRIRAAKDAGTDVYLIARTDAAAGEGLSAALDRAAAYVKEGADAIFAEALEDTADYQKFRQHCDAPVLANMTEFGRTPITSAQELHARGADMVLYPLSAFRAMARAAEKVYAELAETGTQASLLDDMQTRAELYEVLHYHDYENRMDVIMQRRESRREEI